MNAHWQKALDLFVMAVADGEIFLMKTILEMVQPEIQKTFINSCSTDGRLPIFATTKPSVLHWLLQNGANPNLLDQHGNSLLYLLAENAGDLADAPLTYCECIYHVLDYADVIIEYSGPNSLVLSLLRNIEDLNSMECVRSDSSRVKLIHKFEALIVKAVKKNPNVQGLAYIYSKQLTGILESAGVKVVQKVVIEEPPPLLASTEEKKLSVAEVSNADKALPLQTADNIIVLGNPAKDTPMEEIVKDYAKTIAASTPTEAQSVQMIVKPDEKSTTVSEALRELLGSTGMAIIGAKCIRISVQLDSNGQPCLLPTSIDAL